MKRRPLIVCTMLLALGTGGPVLADQGCSLKDVAGKWIFATDIGRITDEFAPPDTEITALGTMNISRDGSVSGRFDVTLEFPIPAPFDFRSNVTYWGTISINPDCTGTLTFETDAPSSRTDTIALVSRKKMLGMSQDPTNLWTYEVHRIARNLVDRKRDDDD